VLYYLLDLLGLAFQTELLYTTLQTYAFFTQQCSELYVKRVEEEEEEEEEEETKVNWKENIKGKKMDYFL